VTAPRIIVPGATTAITRRTTMRKAFLAPWHPGVKQAWLYAMALAQSHTRMAIHHATLVINHHHVTGTPEDDQLPLFLQMFHHELSCALNTLLARERYDQPGELLDKRSTHLMRLCDEGAQSTTLAYERLNTAAAGLVARPEHMPGFVFDFGLWKAGYIEVPRPDFYFSVRQPKVLRLEVTPPPLLYRAFGGDMDKLVHAMERLVEQGLRELRAKRKSEPLGARRITRLHPWSEPRTLRETRGGRIPTFRIGARGIVGQQQHIEAAVETRAFRQEHREVRLARAAGAVERVAPYGTYLMRVRHGAPMAPPPEPFAAIVTRPGPTLREVKAELEARAARGVAPVQQEPRFELMQQSGQALRDEAEALCEHACDGMDFRSPPRAVSSPSTAASDEGDPQPDEAAAHPAAHPDRSAVAVVRHRFDPPDRDGRDRASRRVVTLRDRRMGRRHRIRHGSDPPA
jgi:hypothetical protein